MRRNLTLEPSSLNLMRANWEAVRVSPNDGVVVLMVRREEVVGILRPNEDIVSLE